MLVSAHVLLIGSSSKNLSLLQSTQNTLKSFGIRSELYHIQKRFSSWNEISERILKTDFLMIIGLDLISIGAVRKKWPHLPCLLAPLELARAKKIKRIEVFSKNLTSHAAVPTFALGHAGQINAALFVVACLATLDPKVKKKLELYRKNQTAAILKNSTPATL